MKTWSIPFVSIGLLMSLRFRPPLTAGCLRRGADRGRDERNRILHFNGQRREPFQRFIHLWRAVSQDAVHRPQLWQREGGTEVNSFAFHIASGCLVTKMNHEWDFFSSRNLRRIALTFLSFVFFLQHSLILSQRNLLHRKSIFVMGLLQTELFPKSTDRGDKSGHERVSAMIVCPKATLWCRNDQRQQHTDFRTSW